MFLKPVSIFLPQTPKRLQSAVWGAEKLLLGASWRKASQPGLGAAQSRTTGSLEGGAMSWSYNPHWTARPAVYLQQALLDLGQEEEGPQPTRSTETILFITVSFKSGVAKFFPNYYILLSSMNTLSK